MKRYFFNFSGFSIAVSLSEEKCFGEPKKAAKALAKAEALRNHVNFLQYEYREISDVEYYILRPHKRIEL